ncbi:hypothetical protein M9H77_18565 [Catharanthus roseus]|uniref:Uncharacterized protein n=1 Tax=Catharanthus roseus TaxID=4058 RepID=A0ACC0B7V5_CATRO|nr:hypothetical protein M9H77_18565 [Catharanthus roseus]
METLLSFIMSTDAQLPTPHDKGTSESPHSILNPMRIILQELQSMRREMGDIKEVKVTLKGMSIPILKGVIETTIIMVRLERWFKALVNSMMVVNALLLEVEKEEV